MKNYVNEGKTMAFTASGAKTSGQLVIVGILAGVCNSDVADGASGILDIEGVFDLPAATAAITQGARVYWDADGDPVGGESGSGACTATSTDNTAIGVAVAAKAGTVGTARVKLMPVAEVEVAA